MRLGRHRMELLSLGNTTLRSRVRWLGRVGVASLHTSACLPWYDDVVLYPLHLRTVMNAVSPLTGNQQQQ